MYTVTFEQIMAYMSVFRIPTGVDDSSLFFFALPPAASKALLG